MRYYCKEFAFHRAPPETGRAWSGRWGVGGAVVKSDQRFCEAFLRGKHRTPSLTFRSGPFNQNANSLFEQFNLLALLLALRSRTALQKEVNICVRGA
jgi:hypothetical protein